MENELKVLINRTRLAAEYAEKSAFYGTAQSLQDIAQSLINLSAKKNIKAGLLQHLH